MPKLFLRCSFLKCREQTLVESVILKCLPVSLRIACSHCALKLVSVGMLKNPTFSPFGPVVPFRLQSGTQQYRFCGDLFSFMVKKGTLYNHALNYTTRSSVFFLLESSPASFSCTRTEAYPSHPPLRIRCIMVGTQQLPCRLPNEISISFYCSTLWSHTTATNIKKIQAVQNFACRIITKTKKFEQITPALREIKWLPVNEHLHYRDTVMTFRCMKGLAPTYLCESLRRRKSIHYHNTRNRESLDIPPSKTKVRTATFPP